MGLTIVEEGFAQIAAYSSVPIAFVTSSRVDVESLRNGLLNEVPMDRRVKDYDAFEDERPAALPWRFDISNWTVLSAFDGEERLGGVILARETPGFDMLEGRKDLGVLVDIRVTPQARGRGVGRALLAAAEARGRELGCIDLKVETQDINVTACRFYSASGFVLSEVHPDAYGPELDEVQIIWRKTL